MTHLYKPKSVQEVRAIIADRVIGKIAPRHDEHGHHYEFLATGKVVDSVTTQISVPKPHLLKWYGRKALEWMEPMWRFITRDNREEMFTKASMAGEYHRDDAGDVGTEGHNAIERYLKAWIESGVRPVDIRAYLKEAADPRSVAVARSAERFFKEHPNVEPVATELLVGDEQLGAAGQLDVLLWEDGELVVDDWKSSNSVGSDYAIQVATYRHCLQKMTGLKVSKCRLTQLSKKYDKYDRYTIPNPHQAFLVYASLSKTYQWLHNGKEKLVPIKNILRM